MGRGYFETERKRFNILDAPGHKNYVPNMISGAAQADVAVLVISARKGEFETGFEKGGQTREHAMLAKTLGVKKMVVVINKMDDPTVQWARERYDECVAKLTPYLKSCGFVTAKDVDFMPLSGFTGANVKEPLSPAVCPWYQGPSLLAYLNEMTSWERRLADPFLMPIAEKTKEMGTLVSGKIEAGTVKRGDMLLIMPNKVSMRAAAWLLTGLPVFV